MPDAFHPSGYCSAWRQQAGLPPATGEDSCQACPHFFEGCSASYLGAEWVRVDDVIRPDGSRPAAVLTPDQLADVRALLADLDTPPAPIDDEEDEWASPLLRWARQICDETRRAAGLPLAGDGDDCRQCPVYRECEL